MAARGYAQLLTCIAVLLRLSFVSPTLVDGYYSSKVPDADVPERLMA